jgi:hypothetical protein
MAQADSPKCSLRIYFIYNWASAELATLYMPNALSVFVADFGTGDG